MINIRNLSYMNREIRLLDNLNLHIHRSDFVVLFGPEYEMRSQFVHCIMGYEKSYTGTVEVQGINMKEKDASLRGAIRYVPDDVIWEEKCKAGSYLSFVASSMNNYDFDLQNKLCMKLGVNPQENLLEMTFENNKLIQIISAICSKPRMVIINEPCTFISKNKVRKLFRLLASLNQTGMGVIVLSENYEELKTYCNRYIYMKEGKIQRDEYVQERDVRIRIVTIEGERSETLAKILGEYIGTKNGRSAYRYERDLLQLPYILNKIKCSDFMIEEMTLAEEIDMDTSRWE